jgi:hypothetical protein
MATILFIDDAPDEVNSYRDLVGERAEVLISHPDEVDVERLYTADLILIDYKIDYWPARENIKQVCLKPLRGVALAAVLRDYVNNPERKPSPVAFGILSGHIDELSGGLPVEHRKHVLAATNNLEWIFTKDAPKLVADQAVSLASAVSALPRDWPANNRDALEVQLTPLLQLNDLYWKQRAFEDVERCHPPVHELSEWSHGLAIVRWLLHQILPYPCFLLDAFELALRLRVTPKSLDQASARTPFLEMFASAAYTGILSGFAGPRWWRSGVESLLWERTNGRSFEVPALHSLLASSIPDLEMLNIDDPVICLDRDYGRMENIVSSKQAVRIQPDHWPPYAEPAWTTIDLARENPNLKALVIEQDRAAVQNAPEVV